MSPISLVRSAGDGPEAEEGAERSRNEQMMCPVCPWDMRYENSVTTRLSSRL